MTIPQELHLFMGFPLNATIRAALEKLSPDERLYLIKPPSDEGDYLEEMRIDEVVYLGKRMGPICDRDQAELFQAHIISLINKFLPEQNISAMIRIIPFPYSPT